MFRATLDHLLRQRHSDEIPYHRDHSDEFASAVEVGGVWAPAPLVDGVDW